MPVFSDNKAAVNPSKSGTKAAAHYTVSVEGGAKSVIRCRLYNETESPKEIFGDHFNTVFDRRRAECDKFYKKVSNILQGWGWLRQRTQHLLQ